MAGCARAGRRADSARQPTRFHWLREVVLLGDDQPWLLGRTVIPERYADRPRSGVELDLDTLPLQGAICSAAAI